MQIFVYGTLLKGLSRSDVLRNGEFLGNAFVRGNLGDLGAFPGLKPGDGTVYGELYAIDDEILSMLDRIEGFRPDDAASSLYIRENVEVVLMSTGFSDRAETYFYNGTPKPDSLIEHGDYRRYQLEKADSAWYLAYGSNMSSEQLNDRVGEWSEVCTGFLAGYQLMFNKRSGYGSAKANVQYIGGGSRCPVAAYYLTAEQFDKLDKHEGVPGQHYVRVGMPFTDIHGTIHLGQIYLAHIDKLTDDLAPSEDYLNTIRTGYREHGFDDGLLPTAN